MVGSLWVTWQCPCCSGRGPADLSKQLCAVFQPRQHSWKPLCSYSLGEQWIYLERGRTGSFLPAELPARAAVVARPILERMMRSQESVGTGTNADFWDLPLTACACSATRSRSCSGAAPPGSSRLPSTCARQRQHCGFALSGHVPPVLLHVGTLHC